jgi:hypothetical protein
LRSFAGAVARLGPRGGSETRRSKRCLTYLAQRMPRYWFVLIGLLTCLSLPACLPRDRLNVDCEWTERDRRALDLRKSSDQQHLNQDVDIAIEVIMRSADAEHGRRYGYSAHGGYVDGGRFRDECREKVFAAIADVHGLTLEQVRNAGVTRTRDWRIALMAAVPFAALYYIGAVMLCRIWTARFSPDEQRQRFVAFAITSVAASIAGVQLAVLWFNIAEMLRVGNDHLGQTRAFPTSSPYLLAMFLAGLLLFSLAALRQYRRRSPNPLAANEHFLRLNSQPR